MKPLATIKCPYCFGQTNNERKTLYIYSTDTYWCARCKAYGLISDLEPSQLQGITIKSPVQADTKLYTYNDTGSRFSVCKHRYSDSIVDTFQIKLPDGSLVGHYHRYHGKQSKIEGVKGFCYREKFLDLNQTYRLVEGVYDCIYPNDVAVLGYPTIYQAKALKWYRLILCPDGDVWNDVDNLKKWLDPFCYFKNCVVEYIPNSLDPDECRQEERKQVDFKTIKEWLDGR